MDFYNLIKDLDRDSKNGFIDYKIKQLKEDQNNYKIIGCEVPNKSLYNTLNGFGVRCIYDGFITDDVKIVYAANLERNGNFSDNGNHYYIKDDQYIYDFFDYIAGEEINDIYTMLYYIQQFLDSYFNGLGELNREDMFVLLKDKAGIDIQPNLEHTIEDFRGKGNAKCSEYSSMAQNILSVLNIDSCLVFGAVNVGELGGAHAYNVLITDEGKILLTDFSLRVNVYDIDHNIIGHLPFIGELEQFDNKFVDDLIKDNNVMSFKDYFFMIMYSKMMKMNSDRDREYFIDINREKKKTK